MSTNRILLASIGPVLALSLPASAVTYVINRSANVFTPSTRGQPNTTYFGWGPGSFDGTTDNELIDNPPTTLGGAAGAALNQNGTADILASSNNIYTAGNTLDLTITAPTNGTPAAGFTSLIVQGRTAFGGFGSPPAFAPVAGVSPTVVVGDNAAASGQFWAKYDLPGNAATYDVGITGGTFLSIGTLTVDTYWSAAGFQPDVAVVPEPASIAAVAGVGGLMLRRRRSR